VIFRVAYEAFSTPSRKAEAERTQGEAPQSITGVTESGEISSINIQEIASRGWRTHPFDCRSVLCCHPVVLYVFTLLVMNTRIDQADQYTNGVEIAVLRATSESGRLRYLKILYTMPTCHG